MFKAALFVILMFLCNLPFMRPLGSRVSSRLSSSLRMTRLNDFRMIYQSRLRQGVSRGTRSITSLYMNEPPPEPNFSDKKLKIIKPKGEKYELEIVHPHEIDLKLTFDEDGHKYYYNNAQMKLSVTQLVENYFSKFDADDIIDKMMKGSRWPRPEYTWPNGEPMNATAIKNKWDGIGLYARNRGTWMHFNIERKLNNLPPSNTIPEMTLFEKFYMDHIVSKNVKPWRTEWRIVAPDINLAGSIDFIGKNIDGSFTLYDWKRAKDLRDKLTNQYEKRAKPPIDHLDDCDGAKYFLQLNIYRYILQKYYNIYVSNMVLASFHPNLDSYFHVEVPIWDGEVHTIINDLKGIDNGNSLDTSVASYSSDKISSPLKPPSTSKMNNPF